MSVRVIVVSCLHPSCFFLAVVFSVPVTLFTPHPAFPQSTMPLCHTPDPYEPFTLHIQRSRNLTILVSRPFFP